MSGLGYRSDVARSGMEQARDVRPEVQRPNTHLDRQVRPKPTSSHQLVCSALLPPPAPGRRRTCKRPLGGELSDEPAYVVYRLARDGLLRGKTLISHFSGRTTYRLSLSINLNIVSDICLEVIRIDI